jgi:hypothetical protein
MREIIAFPLIRQIQQEFSYSRRPGQDPRRELLNGGSFDPNPPDRARFHLINILSC